MKKKAGWNKRELKTNVYEEAKKRINYLIDNYDDIYVGFSGGKDSLVLVELMDEVYKERGIKEKLKVFHHDEEFLPQDVVDFVDGYVKSGRFDFRYYCLKMNDFRYIMGKRVGYTKWDDRREWIRSMPEYAITDDKVHNQYTTDGLTVQDSKGKSIIALGLRADESFNRLQGVMRSAETRGIRVQIVEDSQTGVDRARPIYDWTEKDIFKYLYDKEIKYAKIYDSQVITKSELRVSSSMSVESCKRLPKLKQMYPDYFEQICQLYPDIRIQEKYWEEFDAEYVLEKYPYGWKGMYSYIMDNYSGLQRKEAIKRMQDAMKAKERIIRNPKKERAPLQGYPIRHVFMEIIKGNIKRSIMPKGKPTQQDFEYEEKCYGV